MPLSHKSTPNYNGEAYENTRLVHPAYDPTSSIAYDPHHASDIAPLNSHRQIEVNDQPTYTNEKRPVSSIDPRKDRLISRVRLSLRILSFLFSVSIVAVLGHAVYVYVGSKDNFREMYGAIIVRVWLKELNTKPTYVLLGIASAAALLSLILILASFTKAIRRVTNISNLATAVISVIGIALWLSVGIYYKVDGMNTKEHMDITSYTCAHKSHPILHAAVGNMGVMCGELRYAWWAVMMVGVLELASLTTVGWSVIAMRKGSYVRM